MVGKTTLMDQLTTGHFSSVYEPTVLETVLYHLEVDSELHSLEIVDCSSDRSFSVQRSAYIATADLVIFTYSVLDKNSLQNVKVYAAEVAKVRKENIEYQLHKAAHKGVNGMTSRSPYRAEIPLFVVGTHTDLTKEEVDYRSAEKVTSHCLDRMGILLSGDGRQRRTSWKSFWRKIRFSSFSGEKNASCGSMGAPTATLATSRSRIGASGKLPLYLLSATDTQKVKHLFRAVVRLHLSIAKQKMASFGRSKRTLTPSTNSSPVAVLRMPPVSSLYDLSSDAKDMTTSTANSCKEDLLITPGPRCNEPQLSPMCSLSTFNLAALQEPQGCQDTSRERSTPEVSLSASFLLGSFIDGSGGETPTKGSSTIPLFTWQEFVITGASADPTVRWPTPPPIAGKTHSPTGNTVSFSDGATNPLSAVPFPMDRSHTIWSTPTTTPAPTEECFLAGGSLEGPELGTPTDLSRTRVLRHVTSPDFLGLDRRLTRAHSDGENDRRSPRGLVKSQHFSMPTLSVEPSYFVSRDTNPSPLNSMQMMGGTNEDVKQRKLASESNPRCGCRVM